MGGAIVPGIHEKGDRGNRPNSTRRLKVLRVSTIDADDRDGGFGKAIIHAVEFDFHPAWVRIGDATGWR